MPFEMTMLLAVILLPIGLAILIKGADFLVDGAVALAERLGVSPLVIGLTIVAMGTSAPEVAASMKSALSGMGDAAIGNVYGSNIANLALIGGICAIVRPITVRLGVLKREMPIMIGVGLLLYPILHNMHLGRGESILLLVLFLGMISYTVWGGLREGKQSPAKLKTAKEQIDTQTKDAQKPVYMDLLFILLGLIGLAVGANITVESGAFLGRKAGMNEEVIGLTIFAIGTSLPELMTCLVAATKGHDDLSIGNLVGSNIFNTMLVVGAAGAIKPFYLESESLVGVNYWVMIGFNVVFVAVAMMWKRISRSWGAIFVTGYLTYIGYLAYETFKNAPV